jgi:MarR family transcriptional regulator, lower aerobic nicotinate degradation pathway regulator
LVPSTNWSRLTRIPAQLTPADSLAQLSFLVHGTLERRAAARELSMSQLRLLGILRDRRPTMQTLAEMLGLDKSSATGLVDRAERRGLVARARSATDGRSIIVALTPHGHRLIDAAASDFETEIETLLAPLDPGERVHLAQLISRVLAARAAERGIDLFATDGITGS